jgi:hypothetical protein
MMAVRAITMTAIRAILDAIDRAVTDGRHTY